MIISTGGFTAATQVLDLETLEWQEAGDLPAPLTYPAFVDYGDSTFIIGGSDGDSASFDYILGWNPDSYTWSMMEQRLELPLSEFCAVLVDDSKVVCS